MTVGRNWSIDQTVWQNCPREERGYMQMVAGGRRRQLTQGQHCEAVRTTMVAHAFHQRPQPGAWSHAEKDPTPLVTHWEVRNGGKGVEPAWKASSVVRRSPRRAVSRGTVWQTQRAGHLSCKRPPEHHERAELPSGQRSAVLGTSRAHGPAGLGQGQALRGGGFLRAVRRAECQCKTGGL